MTTTMTTEQQARLVDAISWAAGQDARRRLGLPSEWDQRVWFADMGIEDVALGGHCGTVGCLAGYVVLAQLHAEPSLNNCAARLPNGPWVTVKLAAREALGLTWEQGQALFHELNTLDDLIRIGRKLLAGEPLDDEDD